MLGPRPRSPEDYLLQDVLNPAKRPCLREPGCPEWLAQPDLEDPSGPTWEEPNLVVVLPAGFTLKLHLEGVNLLLEPNPTSIVQVSLPGCTITLVREDLLVPGQPGVWPCTPQGAAIMDMPQEHLVLLHLGSATAPGSHIEGPGNAAQPGEVSYEDFMVPWTHAPADMDPGLFDSFTGMLSPLFDRPWMESPLSGGRYAPWSNWSLRESMLEPLPSSPLQPLPPSPPTSPQAQRPQSHQKLPHSPCKARKRLF
ncbi:proline-rich protein 23A3-like [Phodopus roborovskii]|uniref:proline-rich protein 23A3-like n=1 Tax=Phodopus roborovskii TaxID=109678 RepID=UPI0021E508A1|nr:proline-rich protein 23A3-like [Phodopus roborovskii]